MRRIGVLGTAVMALLVAQAPGVASADLPVPVPTVEAPELPPAPVPTVQAPSLPVPKLPVPSSPAPAPVPSAPVPVPDTSDVPVVGDVVSGVTGGSSGSSGGGGGSSATGGGSPAAGGGGSAGGGTSPASGGSGGTPTTAGATAGTGGGAAATPSRAVRRASGGGRSGRVGQTRRGERRSAGSAPAASVAERRERRERRLRRVVRRLDGCLPAIAHAQRRVLVLRTGLGPARAHSRAEVARRLGLRTARVARLERRGVRTLRRIDRTTGCAPGGVATAGGGMSVVASLGGPFGEATAQLLGGGSAMLAAMDAGRAGDGAGRDAAGDTEPGSAPARGGVAGASAEQPATVLPPGRDPGAGTTPVLILLGLLVLLGFGLRALRETRT